MKITTKIGLGIIILILSACGENPMLKPQMVHELENEMVQHSTLKERINCVEYATNPEIFNLRQTVCSTWMQNQYKNYVTMVTGAMAAASIENNSASQSNDVTKVIPTYKEFSDPKVWQTIWNENAEKWEQELATENLNKEKAVAQPVKKPQVVAPTPAKYTKNCGIIPPQKKVVKVIQAVTKPCIKVPVCERFPASMACHRIKMTVERNNPTERVC